MIVAVISRKGGVGKTTTAVSLAAGLARQGHRCLLVDLDPQGSASLSIGVARSELAPSVADVLLNRLRAEEAIRSTRFEHLDVLTSSIDLGGLDDHLLTLRERDKVLRNKLLPFNEVYDVIVLDCPAGLTLLGRLALVASEGYVVPATPSYLALEGLDGLIKTAERLGFKNGCRSRFLGVLLTMVDYRTRVHRQVIEKIRQEYGRQVFAVEVRVNVRLTEAPALGQTIFEYDDKCTGARAYDLVAEELLLRARLPGRDSAPDVPTPPTVEDIRRPIPLRLVTRPARGF